MPELLDFIQNWRHGKTAEDIFSKKLLENPFYPFEFDPEREVFEYSAVYPEFYVYSLLSLGCLVCSLLALFLELQQEILWQSGFVYCLAAAVAAHNFRRTRQYTIFPGLKQFQFASDNHIHVRGPISNCYIRLEPDLYEKTATRSRMYVLVLDGYQMDRQILTLPGNNVSDLRKLGKSLAANLGINYFDIASASKHHDIRHMKPSFEKLVSLEGE